MSTYGGPAAPSPFDAHPQDLGLVASGRGAEGAFARVGSATMEVHHPVLKAPIVVPFDQISAVARPTVVARTTDVLHGSPTSVRIGPRRMDGNVVLVLRTPVRAASWRSGAEQKVWITKAQARKGVDIDMLGLTATDPKALVGALAARGVAVADLKQAEIDRFGLAGPDEVLEGIAKVRAKRRRARRILLGWGTVGAFALPARMYVDEGGVPWGAIGGQGLLTLALMAMVAMVALRLPAPAPADQRQLGGRPSFANRHPGLVALAFLGVLGLAFLVGAWLRGLGVPRVAAYAVAFALPWVATGWYAGRGHVISERDLTELEAVQRARQAAEHPGV